MAETAANDLTESFATGIDLREREGSLLALASTAIGFELGDEGVISRTHWWGLAPVPAFQAAGRIKGMDTILKVQGVRPQTSEITALEQFAVISDATANTRIRPPRLLASMPWSDKEQVEFIAVERLRSEKLITLPTDVAQVKHFYDLYVSYRELAGAVEPWVDKPAASLIEQVHKHVAAERAVAAERFSGNPHYGTQDYALVNQGLKKLAQLYEGVEPVFQHTHLSSDDVFLPNGDDPRFVYTSNFMWGWKPPLYDATFAPFHYPRLLADRYQAATPQLLTEQSRLWYNYCEAQAHSDEERGLLNAVLIEQSIINLTLSVYTMDNPKAVAAGRVITLERDRLQSLL